MSIKDLDLFLLEKICRYLKPLDLINFTQINPNFFANSFWKKRFEKDFGDCYYESSEWNECYRQACFYGKDLWFCGEVLYSFYWSIFSDKITYIKSKKIKSFIIFKNLHESDYLIEYELDETGENFSGHYPPDIFTAIKLAEVGKDYVFYNTISTLCMYTFIEIKQNCITIDKGSYIEHFIYNGNIYKAVVGGMDIEIQIVLTPDPDKLFNQLRKIMRKFISDIS